MTLLVLAGGWGVWLVEEVVVDLAGDGALAAAQDVELGQPLLGVPLHRELGGLMAGHVDQGDAPQGMVGVAIPPG